MPPWKPQVRIGTCGDETARDRDETVLTLCRPRADGRTPYAVAELHGNREVAAWLLARGASDDLLPIDRLVAACSRGDRAAAAAMLTTTPGLRSQIGPEHYAAFYRAAETNDTRALEAMIECGFDPNRGDESIDKTALHVAAMEGWPDAVRVLLDHGASVTARDREFKAQPLLWAAEGSRTQRPGRDHAAVGRLLLDAGSPTDWEHGEEPSEGIIEIVNSWKR
jgi:ankyrin repeat protein